MHLSHRGGACSKPPQYPQDSQRRTRSRSPQFSWLLPEEIILRWGLWHDVIALVGGWILRCSAFFCNGIGGWNDKQFRVLRQQPLNLIIAPSAGTVGIVVIE